MAGRGPTVPDRVSCVTPPFPDRLLSLTLLAFEELSTAAGKDQCLACIEDAFFPPLWAPLLALYRYCGPGAELGAAVSALPCQPPPFCPQERAPAPGGSPGSQHGAAPPRQPRRPGAVPSALPHCARPPGLRCCCRGAAPHPPGDVSPQEAGLHRCGAGAGTGRALRGVALSALLCAAVRALRSICECAEEYCSARDSRTPTAGTM